MCSSAGRSSASATFMSDTAALRTRVRRCDDASATTQSFKSSASAQPFLSTHAAVHSCVKPTITDHHSHLKRSPDDEFRWTACLLQPTAAPHPTRSAKTRLSGGAPSLLSLPPCGGGLGWGCARRLSTARLPPRKPHP